MNKRTIRSHAIRNTYGDAKLANTARNWGDERIYNELAIKVPNRPIKLRKFPSVTTQKRKARELKKVKLMIASGIGAEEAFYLRRESYKEINKYIQEIYYSPVDDEDEKITGGGIAKKTREEERREQWKEWSKTGFPDWVINMVNRINAEGRTLGGKDDSYGFAVIYNAYTKNEDVEKWMKLLVPSRVVADIYEDVRKRG
jgi:hypothetical protein